MKILRCEKTAMLPQSGNGHPQPYSSLEKTLMVNLFSDLDSLSDAWKLEGGYFRHAQTPLCEVAIAYRAADAATIPKTSMSYVRNWVTVFEKAAYRGGSRSLPELPKGTICHGEAYRHHRPSLAGNCG